VSSLLSNIELAPEIELEGRLMWFTFFICCLCNIYRYKMISFMIYCRSSLFPRFYSTRLDDGFFIWNNCSLVRSTDDEVLP
jgi:hypothetical protein